MPHSSYPLFCPVAMASELVSPRWTLLVLCEMWSGSTRFNEINRGVPGMSPTLLTRRLREMEENGLVRRSPPDAQGVSHYLTTPMADELEPVVKQLGEWAQRNVDPGVSMASVDHRMLMWNLRRKIDRVELPLQKCVIQFTLTEDGAPPARYWLVIRPGYEPDLCYADRGFEVDLFIHCQLRALASAWMGHSSFRAEIEAGRISLVGDARLGRSLTRWLVRSCYAEVAAAGFEDRDAELPVRAAATVAE